MAKVAIFTNKEDDRVMLMHYRPSDLTEERRSEAAAMVEKEDIPSAPSIEEDEVARLYFKDGEFEYKVEKRPNSEEDSE